MKTISYPYLPPGRVILYVEADHPFMRQAKEVALSESLDDAVKTGSIVVRDDEVLAGGANGSDYHLHNECQRVKLGCKSGEGYELCEGCHPKNHSEATAVTRAREKYGNIAGADLYLWGHWWCCEPCWKAMMASGIRNVYLLKKSEILFNKEHPNNILGVWS